jgi:hypothetical protein
VDLPSRHQFVQLNHHALALLSANNGKGGLSLGRLSQAEVETLLLKLILDELEALILRDGD